MRQHNKGEWATRTNKPDFWSRVLILKPGSRTEPAPRTGKNRFFFGEPEPNLNCLNLRSLNLNRTRTFNISNLGTRTEPESLKFYASEPEPIIFRVHKPEQKSFSNNV